MPATKLPVRRLHPVSHVSLELLDEDVPDLVDALVRVQPLAVGQSAQECQVDVQQCVQFREDAVNHVLGESRLVQHAMG